MGATAATLSHLNNQGSYSEALTIQHLIVCVCVCVCVCFCVQHVCNMCAFDSEPSIYNLVAHIHVNHCQNEISKEVRIEKREETVQQAD